MPELPFVTRDPATQQNFDALNKRFPVALSSLATAVQEALVPAGSVLGTARSTAPTGFLLCEGQAISRTTYKALFEAIGTAFGEGDKSTTFNVPDLRGRVPVGVDGAAARLAENDTLGKSGGEEKHTLTEAEMPAHLHKPGGGGVKFVTSGSGEGANIALGGGGYVVNAETTKVGGDGAHNVMQPFQIINYMIKI